MPLTLRKLLEEFSDLVEPCAAELGDITSARPLLHMCHPSRTTAQSLVFIGDQDLWEQTPKDKQAVAIIPSKMAEIWLPDCGQLVLLKSKNVPLAMARIGLKYFKPEWKTFPAGIHPTAVIGPQVEMGDGVFIGPYTIIGAGCVIGAHVTIGAHCVIEDGVQIGARSMIHALNYIGAHCQIGEDCEIQPQCAIGKDGFGYAHDEQGQHHRIQHYGLVRLGNRVRIGSHVTIDRGTFEDATFADNVIVDSHCHFGHNFQVGENTIIAGGFLTAGSVKVGKNCVFGGHTVTGGHLSVVDHCQFAGMSALSKSVDQPGQYGGYPLQDLKSYLKTYASLPSLPKWRQQLALVLKTLGLEDKK